MPVIINCEICNSEIRLKPSAAKKRRTCSRTCHAKLKSLEKSGENHPRWKGGVEIHCKGYIRVHQPHHPKAHKGKVFEHRLVMEKYLGRFLTSDEIIHHKNGVRNDNRIENLQLTTRKAHINIHRKDLR